MKTLRELAELVKDRERELAYGSETIVLGTFVSEYDYVSRILDGESHLDADMPIDDSVYNGYVDAYNDIEHSTEG